MIKTTIKHFIFDVILNNLFNKIDEPKHVPCKCHMLQSDGGMTIVFNQLGNKILNFTLFNSPDIGIIDLGDALPINITPMSNEIVDFFIDQGYHLKKLYTWNFPKNLVDLDFRHLRSETDSKNPEELRKNPPEIVLAFKDNARQVISKQVQWLKNNA